MYDFTYDYMHLLGLLFVPCQFDGSPAKSWLVDTAVYAEFAGYAGHVQRILKMLDEKLLLNLTECLPKITVFGKDNNFCVHWKCIISLKICWLR